MQVFDPNQKYAVLERRLPHWSQAGTITFVTWRTWDSMPEEIIREWRQERDAWLVRHAIDPAADDWQERLLRIDRILMLEYQRLLSDRWNEHLDACHGACVLRKPELAKIVADSFMYFDGQRYEISDFVVMPNHVHALVVFPDEAGLLTQCESWKHFTASKINRILGRNGRFWQQDGFDHLVRSQEQFDFLRMYIAENPMKAKLGDVDFMYYSKSLSSRGA